MYDHMEKVLAPIRERRKQIVESGVPVRRILAEGTEKARKIAEKKMKEVREAIGI
jgi:tryptophanyl-tRNA synthetase